MIDRFYMRLPRVPLPRNGASPKVISDNLDAETATFYHLHGPLRMCTLLRGPATCIVPISKLADPGRGCTVGCGFAAMCMVTEHAGGTPSVQSPGSLLSMLHPPIRCAHILPMQASFYS